MDHVIFVTKAGTPYGANAACALIESLRTFGGELSDSPFWLFDTNPQGTQLPEFETASTRVIPLQVPEPIHRYALGDKVYACARAEELAPPGTQSLVWIDPLCLVVNPPLLYQLGETCDAAFRPVHIRNVGLRVTDHLDVFWKTVYEVTGGADLRDPVESFVDGQTIRPYFNTHAFTINPALGLLRRWLIDFEQLVCDATFQANTCQDDLHQVFLHQAVLSALVAASVKTDRLRILPPTYNYPYNLHARVPLEKRAEAINDLVSFTYEDRSLSPEAMDDIEVQEPLKSWLAGRDLSG